MQVCILILDCHMRLPPLLHCIDGSVTTVCRRSHTSIRESRGSTDSVPSGSPRELEESIKFRGESELASWHSLSGTRLPGGSRQSDADTRSRRLRPANVGKLRAAVLVMKARIKAGVDTNPGSEMAF